MEKDDGLVMAMARRNAGAALRRAQAKAKDAAKGAKSVPAASAGPEGRKPKCLVLAGFGLNSESELAYAFSLGGAEPHVVHFSDISSGRRKLEDYEIFAIPGGWSFGDDIGGGRVLASKLKHTFRREFEAFASAGKPIIGVCNGFQVLVKLGALPNLSSSFLQESTLTSNASGRFEDRWVYLKPQKSACRYFEGIEFINCPVRHGEGRFLMKDDSQLSQLEKKGMVALKYADERLDDSAGYPFNPNGSPRNIAGICDPTGRIFALMPHPECSVKPVLFPRFTEGISHEKNSIRFFANVVKAGREFV
jgi:phosphoribosylformylglycinamidine synthase subunit PurQ / glutaminase